MRTSSNNHYRSEQILLPFTDIQSNKVSEDDTGYDSLVKQDKPRNETSSGGLSSSSSSSNNQFDRILNLVKNIPSPTDISTPSDVAVNVAQRIAQFSKVQSIPVRKSVRTRVQPLPDTTSESADSIARSNHLVVVSSYRQQISQPTALSTIDIFGNHLEYVHDDRFDSTTTVDDVKEDVIAIELVEQQPPQTAGDFNPILLPSWTKRLRERIRSLPVVIFLGLLSGFLASALLIMIIV